MFERFTDRARKVLQLANRNAQLGEEIHVHAAHIFLGMVKEGSGVAISVMENLKVDYYMLASKVEQYYPSPQDVPYGPKLPLAPEAKAVIETAIEVAGSWGMNYVGTEHLLYGMLVQSQTMRDLFFQQKVTMMEVEKEVLRLKAEWEKDCTECVLPGETKEYQWTGTVGVGGGGTSRLTAVTWVNMGDLCSIEFNKDVQKQQPTAEQTERKRIVALLTEMMEHATVVGKATLKLAISRITDEPIANKSGQLE